MQWSRVAARQASAGAASWLNGGLRCGRCKGSPSKRDIALRDSLTILVCATLAFVRPLMELLGESTARLAIFGAVLTLRPKDNSSVGATVDTAFFVILLSCAAVVLALVASNAFPHSIAANLVMFFVCAMLSINGAAAYPRIRLPVVVSLIGFGELLIRSFSFHNFDASDLPPSEAFKEETQVFMISLLIPVGVSLLAALTVRPWLAIDALAEALRDTFQLQIGLAKDLRCTVQAKSQKELESCQGALDQGVERVHAKTTESTKHTFNLLLETRFLCDGSGQRTFENVRTSRDLTRLFNQLCFEARQLQFVDDARQLPQLVEVFLGISDILPSVATLLINPNPETAQVHWVDCKFQAHSLSKATAALERETLASADEHLHVRMMREETWSDVEAEHTKLLMLARLAIVLAEMLQTVVETKSKELKLPRPRLDFSDMRTTMLHLATSAHEVHNNGSVFAIRPKQGLMDAISGTLFRWVNSEGLRNGLRGAVSGTALISLSFAPMTHAYFEATAMTNAMSTNFSMLLQLHLGNLVTRGKVRVSGIVAGYVWAGAMVEVAGAIHASSVAKAWTIYALGLPLVVFLVQSKLHSSNMQYFAYSMAKEYFVLTVLFLTNPSSDSPANIWITGGFVSLNTLIGALVALLVGVFLFRITALSKLKAVLATTFEHLVVMGEGGLFLQLNKGSDQPLPLEGSLRVEDLKAHLRSLRFHAVRLARRQAPVLWKTSKKEPFLVVDHAWLGELVQATGRVTTSFGILQSAVFRDCFWTQLSQPARVRLEYLQVCILRLTSNAFFVVAEALRGTGLAPPVLMPSICDPLWMGKSLELKIELACREEWGSSASVALELVLLRSLLVAVSKELRVIIDALHRILPSPPYATALGERTLLVMTQFVQQQCEVLVEP
ncbi:Hypothetical protein SCF082_LOCUS47248 [Durusdinium trenchii]|uniref:Uncharacterized protein n=1 Tax=Durusdinium trenchii TaxID=1381693 RepID=A0ABP0RLM8_9DINO